MASLMEENKPTIIVMNKSDILDMTQRREFEEDIKDKFKFASFLPIIFISALNRKGISKIFQHIEQMEERLKTNISKGQLNEFLMDIQMLKKPPRHNGIEVKLKYMTYENKGIPTFVIFANRPDLVHFSYKRFIENQIRTLFNFEGIPIVFKYKR
jgi:GTP-binding protein